MKIFNIRQANFLLREGCIATCCGFGDNKKVYIMFEADDKFKEAMKKWQQRCAERRYN